MTTPPPPLTIGSYFGPYRLDRLIGRGGMGEVYRAYDTTRERTVAIKVLPEHLAQDPVYRQRFQRESRAAARLREAHVVPIHDYGEIEGRLYLDMRLIEGESLGALLHRSGPGSPARTVGLIEQIAAALDAAHADGLLHRDIKPDNILLTSDGFAYLVDFGIAQSVTDSSLTTDGSAVGSFFYMAPERFSSRELHPATDVYALACVLFECLTGVRPFSGDNAAQIMRAHLFDPIPQPSHVRPGLPEAMDQVIARGLAKNPNERYRTAGELAAAARAAIGTEGTNPGVKKPDPVKGPTISDRRSRVLRVAGVLGVLVLVFAALGFAGWTLTTKTTAGIAVPDDTALHGADIDLLSLLSGTGYKRINCWHQPPDIDVAADISCNANSTAGAPMARFLRFQTTDAMHDYYRSVVLGTLQSTSCPGDPAGRDAASMVDGKEVGRKTCFDSRVNNPSAPAPVLVMTNEAATAVGILYWETPSDLPLRNYAAKSDVWQFRPVNKGQDPDRFTDADRALFANTGNDFHPYNCRHGDVSAGVTNAELDCDPQTGFPLVSFVGFVDKRTTLLGYQSDLAQLQGHSCGGNGTDDAWRTSGGAIGRLFCFTDHSSDRPHLCLYAVHEELSLAILGCALSTDNPASGPHSETELLTWFHAEFG